MFEAQKEEKSSSAGMWIGVAVIVVIAAALGWYVMGPKSGAKTETAAPSAAASPSAAAADPVHDLRIVDVKMAKDPTGTVAVWSVDIRNMSRAYSYKDIEYKTTYLGADNSVITQNTGKLTVSLDPGEEQSTQFRDLLYPSGTAIFKFNVTGASSK